MANLNPFIKSTSNTDIAQPPMEVKLKKLHPNAVIPQHAHIGDFCKDLTAVDVEYDPVKDCFVYHTGIAIEVPIGYVAMVFARSSNRNTDAYLPNAVGIIDSGYRGEILVSYKNRTKNDKIQPYNVGDRIAQIAILPYPQFDFIKTEELTNTERGQGGHGSTGK